MIITCRKISSKISKTMKIFCEKYLNTLENIVYQDKELCDVTLATETKSYSAHKLVLAACSPYFRALFAANPCKHPTVFFRDISADQMDLLMEYMYRGRISVNIFFSLKIFLL